jgi:hypothetical protein
MDGADVNGPLLIILILLNLFLICFEVKEYGGIKTELKFAIGKFVQNLRGMNKLNVGSKDNLIDLYNKKIAEINVADGTNLKAKQFQFQPDPFTVSCHSKRIWLKLKLFFF